MAASEVAVRSAREAEAALEHMQALIDARSLVPPQNIEELATYDADITAYAKRHPDALAQLIKFCEAKEKTEKHIGEVMALAYKRSAARWAAKESKLRELALSITKAEGPLEGDVYRIRCQRGVEYPDIYNHDVVPAEFRTVIPEQNVVNKDAVLAALQAKREVPGARLARHDPHVVVE